MARYHFENSTPWYKTLANIRCEAGISRADLAAVVGCDKSTVWRVEHGEQPPSQELIDAYGALARKRMRDACGCY